MGAAVVPIAIGLGMAALSAIQGEGPITSIGSGVLAGAGGAVGGLGAGGAGVSALRQAFGSGLIGAGQGIGRGQGPIGSLGSGLTAGLGSFGLSNLLGGAGGGVIDPGQIASSLTERGFGLNPTENPLLGGLSNAPGFGLLGNLPISRLLR